MDEFIKLSKKLGKFSYELGYFYWQLFYGSKSVSFDDSDDDVRNKESNNRERFRKYILENSEDPLTNSAVIKMNSRVSSPNYNNIDFDTKHYYYQEIIKPIINRYVFYGKLYKFSYEEIAYVSIRKSLIIKSVFTSGQTKIDNEEYILEDLVSREISIFKEWMKFIMDKFSEFYPLNEDSNRILYNSDKIYNLKREVDFYNFYNIETDENDYILKNYRNYIDVLPEFSEKEHKRKIKLIENFLKKEVLHVQDTKIEPNSKGIW